MTNTTPYEFASLLSPNNRCQPQPSCPPLIYSGEAGKYADKGKQDYALPQTIKAMTHILLFSCTPLPQPRLPIPHHHPPQGLLVELGRVRVFDLLPLVVARSRQPRDRG